MFPVSAEYRKSMSKVIRNRFYSKVQIGIFDNTALSDITLNSTPTFTGTNLSNVINNTRKIYNYATFENKRFQLNGTQYLIGASHTADLGFISNELSGANGVFDSPPTITLTFSVKHTFVGFTFNFGYAPAELVVKSYSNGSLVNTVTSSGLADIREVEYDFINVDKIELIFTKTKFSGQRAYLNSLRFGIGYEFTDDDISDMSINISGSPISTELPTRRLSLTLKNENGRFDLEQPTALSTFLYTGQTINIQFGYELDSGEIEWVPYGIYYLEDWDVTRIQAKFNAVGIITTLTNYTYSISKYPTSPISTEDKIKEILNGVGFTNYKITIKNSNFQAIMPEGTVGEMVQLLANNARAYLFTDRYDGAVVIKQNSETPDLNNISYNTNFIAPYSDPNNVTNTENISYATFENNMFKVDGSLYLVPQNSIEYVKNAYVSKNFGDANGTLVSGENYLIFDFDSDTDLSTITINWGATIPKEVMFTFYIDNVRLQNTYTLFPKNRVENYEFELTNISGIRIDFIKSNPNQRVRLDYINFSTVSNFKLTKNEILGDPTLEKLTTIKNIKQSWFKVIPDTTISEIVNFQANTNSGVITVDHEPFTNIIVKTSDPQVNVTQTHYDRVSYITITSPTTEQITVTLSGNKLVTQEYSKSLELNDTGNEYKLENPIIGVQDDVDLVMNWEKDYVERDVNFSVETRGFPELELYDTIYLWNDKIGQIVEHNITYSGGYLKSKLKIRGEL